MSFLRDYAIATQGNEVPKIFHHVSALVTISSLVSSKVWLDQGLYIIRPNLYVVLTAEPGVKKTTAMSIAKRLLRELDRHHKIKIPLSGESQSKEALVVDMTAKARPCKTKQGTVPDRFHPIDDKASTFIYTPMTVMVTELCEFVGIGAGRMIDFLTTIYDEEFYASKTIKRDEEVIPMPFLNVLTCTTPEWVTKRLKDDVISGGFSSRSWFVYESESPDRIPFPEVTKEMTDAWDRLIAYSKKLATTSGPFKWGDGSKDFFSDWYIKLKRPEDPVLHGWFNRKDLHMLKAAMLISLSESVELVIEIPHMKLAIELLEMIEENIPKVFKGVGRNELFGLANQLYDMLLKAPNRTLPEAFIIGQMFREADAAEIAKMIAHLVGSGKVKREHRNQSGKSISFLIAH